MGADQSTRKITVVNDEVSGVIKISDAVVQRLKGEIVRDAEPGQPSAPAPPPPPPPEEAAPPPPPPASDPAAPPAMDPSSPLAAPPPPEPAHTPPAPPTEERVQTEAPTFPPAHVWQRPIIQYIEEPSLSALRVRTEKEQELLQLESYWRERLAGQEAAHVSQTRLSEGEVARSARLVEGLFMPAASDREKLCSEASAAVQGCYSSHPGQPLVCRDTVLQFSQCVHQARATILANSG